MDTTQLIVSGLMEAREVLDNFLSEKENIKRIDKAARLMTESIRNGGKIISCGNGGSMCDAMHFAEELSGRFRDDRAALPAISISDPSHITCVGNDFGFEKIFSRYVEAVGRKGDVLLAISTSGNSRNVIAAIEASQKAGMKVIALTGKNGGVISGKCDVEIRAPHSMYADRAQEIHIKIIHALINCIEQLLKE
jgi:D-sedoheptulose 7-phosphate isomerase